MDSIEKQALASQPSNGPASSAPGSESAAQGHPSPELQQYFDRRKSEIERGVDSKFNQIAELKRSMEQQVELLRQQQAHYAAQMQYGPHQQSKTLSQKVTPDIASRMDDNGKFLLDLIGNEMQDTVRPYAEKLGAYEQEISGLKSQLTQMQQRDREQRLRSEVETLKSTYGEDVLREHSEALSQAAQIADRTGASLTAAFQLAAPGVVLDHHRRQWEKSEADRRKANGFHAGLEGMYAEPSQTPIPEYRPGESMRDSAMAQLGVGRIRSEGLSDFLNR